MSLVNAMLGVSNASAIVKIAFILNFNYVSSLKEQYIMAFVYSLMALPLCGNFWEYYQVKHSSTSLTIKWSLWIVG